jgi:ketosteroid isomerase-like protein
VEIAPVAGNVALVRAAFDEYNRRDVDALCALMTEDVELKPAVSRLTGRVYRGHAGVAAWLRDIDESFSTFHIEPLELRDLGDRVLALARFQAEGQVSGLELGSELGAVLSIEDGLISKWLGYFRHAEAEEAAERRTI